MKARKTAAVLGLVFTGLLLMYAGIAKSANPSSFLFVLEEYQLNWPLGYIHLVAAILPVVEIVLGLLILGNLVFRRRYYRLLTLGAGVGLLTVFLVVMVWALAHRDIFGCGCFGGLYGHLSVWDVLRDALFILLALAGFLDLPANAA
ncbi:MAG TPA: MauE/DoxX family redox-associated membrane protein [Spirochaetia bacterium]|nr:MauE/DoxX family redox-associated membrane protein [Spirochaetia bacterium]